MNKLRRASVNIMLRSISFLPLSMRRFLGNNRLGGLLRRLLSRTEGKEGPRSFEILAGPCKGLKLVADLTQHRAHLLGMYEPELETAIAELLAPGMVAFDVGAHIGYMSLLMARQVTESGKVYVFEPLPSNVELLAKTMQINHFGQVIVVSAAVSSCSGEATLLLGKNPSTNRLIKPEALQIDRPAIQVKTISLDDFAAEAQIQRVDLIKIDIEGHELEALRGAQRLLEQSKPSIVCEFHSVDLYREGTAWLGRLGYVLRDIELYRVPHVVAVHTQKGHEPNVT